MGCDNCRCSETEEEKEERLDPEERDRQRKLDGGASSRKVSNIVSKWYEHAERRLHRTISPTEGFDINVLCISIPSGRWLGAHGGGLFYVESHLFLDRKKFRNYSYGLGMV